MTHSHSAIILTSGGLDSATCLAIAHHEGFSTLYALSFDYGQRHRLELQAANRVAAFFHCQEHRTITIDLRQFGHSALTADIPVPKDRSESAMNSQIPITYVPARNTIFLSYALAYAEVREAADIFIGVNALDYSGYPDCRPEFIEAFENMANLATKSSVTGRKIHIHTPLMQLTKAQIIRRGAELGVDYSITFSCYDPTPDGLSCGHCDSCILRKKGFAEAHLPDPTRYAAA